MTTKFVSKTERQHMVAVELIEAKIKINFNHNLPIMGSLDNIESFFDEQNTFLAFSFFRSEDHWLVYGMFSADLMKEIDNNQNCKEGCFPDCLSGDINKNFHLYRWNDSDTEPAYGVKSIEDACERDLYIDTYKITTQEALNAFADILREYIALQKSAIQMQEEMSEVIFPAAKSVTFEL